MSAYGAAALGGVINAGGTLLSNYLAGIREEQAREENFKYGEQAANNADARTRALYEDYQSPLALLRQYKEAGLSPSLMFANGAAGAGGMTQGAQGEGANGISPTSYGFNLMQGTELALMKAQARKTNAEADTIEGKNERGKTEINELQERIKNIIASTENKGLQNAWYEYENALQSIKVSVQASTQDTQIENYLEELKYLKHKIRSAAVKAEIDENTKTDAEKLMHENVRNVLADTLLKAANKALADANVKIANKTVELNQKQIEDLVSQIETRSKQVDINRDTLNQTIRDWAVENGIITDEHASWLDIMQRTIYSKDGQKIMAELIKALLTN